MILPSSLFSPVRRYLGLALAVAAVGLAGGAALVWTRAAEPRGAVARATSSDERAWLLLQRSLRADAETPVVARVETVVFTGNQQIQSEAELWRAPGRLAINYLSGPMRGQESGFSQRWFWRQNDAGQLQPYAEVAQTPAAMARSRFELMRRNYVARLQAPQELHGRTVEVVELRPLHPAQGARGPARRIFIDTQTGLTLRTEAFNYRLQPVSHSTFSRFELRPTIKPATFEPPAAIAAAAAASFWRGEELGRDERAVARKVGLMPPHSDRVPRGFQVDGVGIHRCARSVPGFQVAVFTRYTDGVNVLTLFAVKTLPARPHPTSLGANKTGVGAPPVALPVDAPATGAELGGNLNCDFGPSTVISRAQGGGTLVAMGDLPSAVLQRTLDAARFREVVPASLGAAPTRAATQAGATATATATATASK